MGATPSLQTLGPQHRPWLPWLGGGAALRGRGEGIQPEPRELKCRRSPENDEESTWKIKIQ